MNELAPTSDARPRRRWLMALPLIGFALLAASPPILITNVIALALAIRAFRRWSTHKA